MQPIIYNSEAYTLDMCRSPSSQTRELQRAKREASGQSSQESGIPKYCSNNQDPTPLTYPTPASSEFNKATKTQGPHSP